MRGAGASASDGPEGKRERLSRGEPPALQAHQRRRMFCAFAEKNGAGANAFAARTALACERAMAIVVCFACRTRVAIACKSIGRLPILPMPVRLDQTNEDAPPVGKQCDHAGGRPATRKVRRDQAAPARLVRQRVENILGLRHDRDPAGRNPRAPRHAKRRAQNIRGLRRPPDCDKR